jgi:NAD(P)-dependent dehydrogenase (short-subunit alcohol dehydrogenase family)
MDCSYLDFSGKIVLVTGGSRGIGRETALAFADAGADIAIASRKLEGLEEVAQEIARAAMFLASSATNYMTGHDLVMNGGAFFR